MASTISTRLGKRMAAVGLAAVVASCQSPEPASESRRDAAPGADTTAVDAPGFLYGRVTTTGGTVYQGRLRWGRGEEAFWNDTFDGVKDENPWAGLPPVRRLTDERRATRVFGFEMPWSEPEMDLVRPFMVRFGDIARIEARGNGVQGVVERGAEFDPDVRVTLKSGAVFDLDRLSAGDFDDGVRVWDRARGAVDLGPRQIRTIEFLPTPRLRGVPSRLYGTVRTRDGAFTGFLQWNREHAVGSDRLAGRTERGDVRLQLGAIRSLSRQPSGGAQVTLRDGRRLVLSGLGGDRQGGRGVYVHDPRYGRVLVSWGALEHVDFGLPGEVSDSGGPAYGDFSPGRPLSGVVTTRAGRRLSGRLVYDLDESETTETLDAPAGGVDYAVPFAQIASVVLPERAGPAAVTLRSGETLELEPSGDLGRDLAGVLVFAEGQKTPDYLPWADVARIDFDSPTATAS